MGKSLKDLVSRLDISVVTESRSANDIIAVKTREHVAEAARELGYVPNRVARTLLSGQFGFAGLAVPKRGYGEKGAFLEVFVAGFTSGFGRLGVDMILTTVPEGKSELSLIQGRKTKQGEIQ